MLAASFTYFPQPKSGGDVTAKEYNQINPTAILALVFDRCPEEKGQLTKQYRSYDKTVSVVMDVIPAMQ